MQTGLSLQEFRSVVHDFARPNRFEIEIVPPQLYTYSDKDYNLTRWTADSAQIPSRTQGERGIKFHGMELKLPGDYTKENFNIGFLNSYGWEGRKFFEDWMEFMQQIGDSNQRPESVAAINSSVYVNQIGRTASETIVSYKFYNTFPTNISVIDLSMENSNQIEKFTVSFSYSHYTMTQVNNNG